jgi:hypothetical protein
VNPDVRDCAGCERNGTANASGDGGVVLMERHGQTLGSAESASRPERGRDGPRPGPLTIFLLSALGTRRAFSSASSRALSQPCSP